MVRQRSAVVTNMTGYNPVGNESDMNQKAGCKRCEHRSIIKNRNGWYTCYKGGVNVSLKSMCDDFTPKKARKK